MKLSSTSSTSTNAPAQADTATVLPRPHSERGRQSGQADRAWSAARQRAVRSSNKSDLKSNAKIDIKTDAKNEERKKNEPGNFVLPALQPLPADTGQFGQPGREPTVATLVTASSCQQSRLVPEPGMADAELPLPIEELSQCVQSGIFELLLPDAETLGVAVDVRKERTVFLLYPANKRRSEQLAAKKKELESTLGQRMEREVAIVLFPGESRD